MSTFISLNFILILVGSLLRSYQCANILVIKGMASPSHHLWLRPLIIALADRGHNVTSISPDFDGTTSTNIHYIHLENTYEHLFGGDKELNFVEAGKMSSIDLIRFYSHFALKSCEGHLTSKGVHTLINYPTNFKFDLVLHDNLLVPCLIGFLHRFGYPPLVHVTAFQLPAIASHWVGSPFNSYVKPYFRNGDSETFFGRVENYGLYFVEYFLKHYYIYPKMSAMSEKVFPNAPTISQLESNVKLVLINSHPAIEIVEPLLPNVIPVGGMQIQTPVVMPIDIKQIADSATDGLILFSLGTHVHTDMLSSERITYIIEAFRKFPKYTFLWKFDSDRLPIDSPENVHIRKWLPQTEILNHKNTILFITHSGLLSTHESVWYGVPMLCMPAFADQHANSKVIKRAEVGEIVPLAMLNSTNLKDTMAVIFSNLSKYRANSVKLSKSFRDQPELPLQRAIWWLEWVLRNPDTKYMNSPARDMNVFSRHAIDVILFFAICLIIAIRLSLKVVAIIIKCLCRNSRESNKVKKH